MDCTEFVNSHIQDLAEAYLSNHRLQILTMVTEGLALAGDAAVAATAEVVGRIRGVIEENPGKYFPRKCCFNCWGPCGRLHRQLENGFCDRNGRILGLDCTQFDSARDLGKRPILINRSNRSRDNGAYVQEELIQLEPELVRIKRTVRNANSGRVLKTKSFDRLIVGDNTRFIRRFVNLMRKSPNTGSVFHNSSYRIPPELKLVKHGIPLVKGETIEQYQARVAIEVNRLMAASSVESYNMDYNTAVKFVCGALTEAENSVRKSCSSFEEFLKYAFPGMSVWQVVEALKQEPLLAE